MRYRKVEIDATKPRTTAPLKRTEAGIVTKNDSTTTEVRSDSKITGDPREPSTIGEQTRRYAPVLPRLSSTKYVH